MTKLCEVDSSLAVTPRQRAMKAAAVGRQVKRFGQGGFQQSGITHPCAATVFRQLHVVNSMDNGPIKPDPATHFASS
jgi:hypothetical protein